METTLPFLIKELETALAVVSPEIEGLQDYLRLNIHDDTRVAVQAALDDYIRRRDLLNSALGSLNYLESNAYPSIPTREVSAEVLADLRENFSTISVALNQFSQQEAVAINIVPGTPEEIPNA